MSKYAAYDQKLLALISEGCNSFFLLCKALYEESAKFKEGPERWRVTERRLQALSKAGLIVFNRKHRVWLRAQVSEVPQ